MRRAMSPSAARAVARKPVRAPPKAEAVASSMAWRLLPLRTPPRIKFDWWRSDRRVGLTRVLPRRPVGVRAPGQVSWLSDHPTPRAFPAQSVTGQWLHAGFVPDYSDGVAADSHRLPWGSHLAGRPDANDAVTLADGQYQVNRSSTAPRQVPTPIPTWSGSEGPAYCALWTGSL